MESRGDNTHSEDLDMSWPTKQERMLNPREFNRDAAKKPAPMPVAAKRGPLLAAKLKEK